MSHIQLSNTPQTRASQAKSGKKGFKELFTKSELWLYGTGSIVYIGLGILCLNWVLNFVIGPLFIVGWVWVVPSLIHRWKRHGS